MHNLDPTSDSQCRFSELHRNVSLGILPLALHASPRSNGVCVLRKRTGASLLSLKQGTCFARHYLSKPNGSQQDPKVEKPQRDKGRSEYVKFEENARKADANIW